MNNIQLESIEDDDSEESVEIDETLELSDATQVRG